MAIEGDILADEKENKEAEQTAVSSDGDYKERLMRLAAEFDNYKKKTRNDIETAKIIGKAELMKKMLTVLDEFEVAIVATEKAKDEGMVKGFALLYSNFLDLLKKEGLKEIPAKGMLNPYMHEALMTMDSEKPDGTILEVVKKGYMLNEILLRPAAVIVAKHEEKKKEEKDDI